MFTGRRVDILDSGSLKIQYNRNRYYDYYTGRWLTQDPLGITLNALSKNVINTISQRTAGLRSYEPFDLFATNYLLELVTIARELNKPAANNQYDDGLNLYLAFSSNPVTVSDPEGLWGKPVHLKLTIDWAGEVGYIMKCATIIGKACHHVDAISSHIGPWPLVGDMSYHFDTTPDGFSPAPGARKKHFDNHYKAAVSHVAWSASWLKVKMGLKELGTALHPLQDTFAHYGIINGHKAEYPMLHAPKVFCTFLGDPAGVWLPFCKWQKASSINWSNPHFPDNHLFWVKDLQKTKIKTMKVLKKFLKYICVSCFCEK